jgi:hypothetical protein
MSDSNFLISVNGHLLATVQLAAGVELIRSSAGDAIMIGSHTSGVELAAIGINPPICPVCDAPQGPEADAARAEDAEIERDHPHTDHDDSRSGSHG